MEIRVYDRYSADEMIPLYESVGWTAYTNDPASLERGFSGSLLALAAFENDIPIGIIRVVGDGHTVILIQDILVKPEFQRQGIGTALIKAVMEKYGHVRQVQLFTDNTEKTTAFYRSMGFSDAADLGCRGFMRI